MFKVREGVEKDKVHLQAETCKNWQKEADIVGTVYHLVIYMPERS